MSLQLDFDREIGGLTGPREFSDHTSKIRDRLARLAVVAYQFNAAVKECSGRNEEEVIAIDEAISAFKNAHPLRVASIEHAILSLRKATVRIKQP